MAILIVTTSACSSQSHVDHQLLIDSLANKNNSSTVARAFDQLKTAKTNAFPALLANLENSNQSHPTLWPAIAALDQNGKPNQYTLGDVCLDLLHAIIEPGFDKSMEDFHVLTKSNAKQWLAKRHGLALVDLKIDATKASLQMAKSRDVDEWTDRVIGFLTRQLQELESAKNAG